MSSTDTEETTDAEEAVEADEVRDALLAELTEALGDDLLEGVVQPGRALVIRVAPTAWKSTHKVLRDQFGFKFFEFLAGIDWLPSPFGKSEDASVDVGADVTTVAEPGDIEQGLAGGDTRFQVFTRLIDIDRGSLGIVIKTDVADGGPLETLIAVFPGANWHERETHEMYGIAFDGHPYLEKLYLPTGFEGNPLRKDFPLLARHVKPWPGIVDVEPMPGEDDEESEGGDE